MSEKSLWASLYAVGRTAGSTINIVLAATFDRLTPETADSRIKRWAKDIVTHAGITLEMHGGEHLRNTGACVVMSNHGSLYDVPIILATFPGRLQMIGKASFFSVPVFGKALRAIGFVPVSRSGSKAEAIAAMDEAKVALKNNASIWLAPEGTRSDDGSLLKFKKGGFHLVKETGAPILPLAIVNSNHILPKHSKLVHRGVTVKLVCGAPISSTDKTIDELMAAVRAHFDAALTLAS